MCTNDAHSPILKLVLLLIILLVIASPAASAERPDIEFLLFPAWVLGHQATMPNGITIEEYTPFGQTVLDWSEMFTWQYFPEWPGQPTPREIMDGLKRIRMAQNPKTEWKIITTTKDSIIYEWKFRESKHNKYKTGFGDHYEIARIVVGAGGTYIFHYATKNANISLHDRRNWARALRKIDVISQ